MFGWHCHRVRWDKFIFCLFVALCILGIYFFAFSKFFTERIRMYELKQKCICRFNVMITVTNICLTFAAFRNKETRLLKRNAIDMCTHAHMHAGKKAPSVSAHVRAAFTDSCCLFRRIDPLFRFTNFDNR